MTKLTSMQLLVLTSACQNDDGLATRPTGLRQAAATKLIASLCQKGFAKEIRAKREAPTWREDEAGRFALKILKAGRAAVEAQIDEALSAEEASKADYLTDGSSRTGNANPAASTDAVEEPAMSPAAASAVPTITPRTGSKRAQVVALLCRPDGATIDDLIVATDWLPHTTRAALSGLRKSGYSVMRSKVERGGGSVYKIAPIGGAA